MPRETPAWDRVPGSPACRQHALHTARTLPLSTRSPSSEEIMCFIGAFIIDNCSINFLFTYIYIRTG